MYTAYCHMHVVFAVLGCRVLGLGLGLGLGCGGVRSVCARCTRHVVIIVSSLHF